MIILSDHLNIHYRSYMQRFLYLLLCSLVLVFTFIIVFIPFSFDIVIEVRFGDDYQRVFDYGKFSIEHLEIVSFATTYCLGQSYFALLFS